MSKNNFAAIFFSFGVIQVVAFINSFVRDLKGGTIDAERFQAEAMHWVESGHFQFATNAEFFAQYLGIIFWIFGESEFLATQFGIAAAIIACIYFIKINAELGVKTPSWAILGFLLWPSFLLRVSTTLREPYLVLFIVLIAYFLILYKKYGRNGDLLKLLFILFLSVLFHKANAVLFVFVMIYIVFFVMKQTASAFYSKTFYMRLVIIAVSVGGLASVLLFFSSVRGLQPLIALLTSDGEYITRVLDYKSGRGFRTTYGVTLDLSSPITFVTSAFWVFLYYMSYPFPWKIQNGLDVLASLEGIFRFCAVIIIFRFGFWKLRFPAAAHPLFILGLLFCFIWAAGTSNYGTASRHHVTTNWVYISTYIMFIAYVLRNGQGKGMQRMQPLGNIHTSPTPQAS